MTIEEKILLIPNYDPYRDSDGYWFDADHAQRCLDFFPDLLTHVKGDLATKPLELEPWLEGVVANIFGWKNAEGYRRYREVFIYVPRKNSKALALDTPLITPSGWTTIGDVKVGDTLFDENGHHCSVTHVKPIQHNKKCYRVNFKLGGSIVAADDHLWEVLVDGRKKVVTTEDIFAYRNRNISIKIANTKPLEYIKNRVGGLFTFPKDRLHPYMLGVWLGDGAAGSSAVSLSDADQEEMFSYLECCERYTELGARTQRDGTVARTLGSIPAPRDREICSYGHKQVSVGTKTNSNGSIMCRACYEYSCKNRSYKGLEKVLFTMRHRLLEHGVLDNKHIPDEYLYACYEDRLELLQGLLDTDGHITKGGQIFFVNSNLKLVEAVAFLVRSLGFKCSIRLKSAKGTEYTIKGTTGTTNEDAYYVSFCAPKQVPVFKLKRKLNRQKDEAYFKTDRIYYNFVSTVEEVPSVPVRCIAVDSPSHLFLAGKELIPTHNTTTIAGLANLIFFTDNEPGAEVYIAAGEREQAGILFGIAKGMILQEPELKKRCIPQKYVILSKDQTSFMKAVSSDAGTKMGFNVHAALIDELHVQPNAELYEALQTGTVARKQPLVICITTADYQRESICNEKYEYACNVRDGVSGYEDPSFLPVIYEAAVDDDWKDPKVWAKANPMLGISVPYDYMEREVRKCMNSPRELNKFRRLHLNIKTENVSRFFNMDAWDSCSSLIGLHGAEYVRAYKEFARSLEGKECFCGLDLASTTDIASFAMVFPIEGKGYSVLNFNWIPEMGAEKRERDAKIPYSQWAKDGFIFKTSGNVIDYDIIREQINTLGKLYNIKDIAVDRWNAAQIMTQLANDGFEITAFGQGMVSMSGPTKELEKVVLGGQLDHGSHPVLRWMAANTDCKQGEGEQVKPVKPLRGNAYKIDGIVACIMGLGCAIIEDEEKGKSMYDTQGVRQV